MVMVLLHHGENGPNGLPGSTREGSLGLPKDRRQTGCHPADDGFVVTAVSLSRKKTQMRFFAGRTNGLYLSSSSLSSMKTANVVTKFGSRGF